MVKGGFENALDLLTVISDPVKYQGLLEGICNETNALEKVRKDVIGVGDAQQYIKKAEELQSEADMLMEKVKAEAVVIKQEAQVAADHLKREAEAAVAERT